MIRRILFRISRTYRANCIMARVLEYGATDVRLAVVRKAVDDSWRLAA